MAHNDSGAGLTSQNLPQARDVVGEGRLRKLRRRHGLPVCLQGFDDGAQARSVRPRAMHEDNIRFLAHVKIS